MREKLQCLSENLMSNNFLRTAVLKKNMNCKLKLIPKDSTEKIDQRALLALEDLEPLFKIFYTFICQKVPGKITGKYMEKLKQASGEI